MINNNIIVVIIILTFLVIVIGFNQTVSKNNSKSKIENYTIAGLFGIAMVSFFYSLTYLVLTFYELNIIIPRLEEGCMSPNEKGDAIGGTMNAIIGICLSSFTALAFYAQYEANKQVKDQFNLQRIRETIQESINQKNKFLDNFSSYDEYMQKKHHGLVAIKEKLLVEIETELEMSISTFINQELETNPEQFINSGWLLEFGESGLLGQLINNQEKRAEIIARYRVPIIKNSRMLLFNTTSNSRFNEKKCDLYYRVIDTKLNTKTNKSFIYSYVLILNYIIELIEQIEDKKLREFLYYSMSQEEQTMIIYIILGTHVINQKERSSIINFMKEMLGKNNYYNEHLSGIDFLRDIELIEKLTSKQK